MIKLRKINDVSVEPLNIPKVEPCNIRGKDLFENLHPNILLLARKNSGKTTVLYKILKKCADKNTKVFIFCSTVYNDPSYGEIVKMFQKKKIQFEAFTDIVEGKGARAINHLTAIVDEFKKAENATETLFKGKGEEEPKEIKFLMFGGEEKVKKEKKPKKLTPKYIFVFDDMSEDLRDPSVEYLLKKNRHLGIMNIISTQSYKDITPSAWKQIDYALLFKNLDEETLSDIRTRLTLPTKLPEFIEIYKTAIDGNYNFLYIDKGKVEYRQNFCSKIEI